MAEGSLLREHGGCLSCHLRDKQENVGGVENGMMGATGKENMSGIKGILVADTGKCGMAEKEKNMKQNKREIWGGKWMQVIGTEDLREIMERKKRQWA